MKSDSETEHYTFVMVKPDGVARNLLGKIVTRFERKGFQLQRIKMMRPSTKLVQELMKKLGYTKLPMNRAQSLSDPSLVERVYQYLHDNRGDLGKPVALAIASVEKLETCDAVQRVLDGTLPNSFVVANYVTIDSSSGVIDRWQILALSPNQHCTTGTDDAACGAAFPLCSSLGACARLFEGSRDGLRAALAHVLAQATKEEDNNVKDKAPLAAALVETKRDPLQQVQYRCSEIYASTRTLRADLKRENVEKKLQTGSGDESGGSGKQMGTCAGCSTAAEQLLSKQRRRKQQNMTFLGLAVLFLIVALVAALIAANQSRAKKQRSVSSGKLNAIYNDMVERRGYDRALESLSTDSSLSRSTSSLSRALQKK